MGWRRLCALLIAASCGVDGFSAATIHGPRPARTAAKVPALHATASAPSAQSTGTQAPPPAKLELPKAKLEATEVNARQWGIGGSVSVPPAAGLVSDDAMEPRAFLQTLMSSRTPKSDKVRKS
jgi:hypothetical protein